MGQARILLACLHAAPSVRSSRLGARAYCAAGSQPRCLLLRRPRAARLPRLALRREGCRLHAYVLMTNHVRLLLTPQSAEGVPRVPIVAGRRYGQHINRTYGRTALGQPRQVLAGPGRDLSAALPALYRAQSGTRRYGGGRGRISLVELPRQCLGRAEPDPDPSSPVSGPRARAGRALGSLPKPLPYRWRTRRSPICEWRDADLAMVRAGMA
jgi:hypothetical protein